MPAGDLDARERATIDRAIRSAEQASRFEFSVFRGVAEGDPRAFAVRLHGALSAPDRSVLVMLDPVGRSLEVVTGREVRRTLSDSEVQLAVAAMQADLAQGDEVGALTRGICLLGDHAVPQRTLHR